MAERKPLFMSSDGFSQEMSPAGDSMQLGGLTMNGDIAMGSNNITGLADAVNPQDAVTYSQLQEAVISGGTIKELLLCYIQLSDAQGILAAMALFFANQPVSGDTITITDGTTTRTYGAASGGDVQFSIGATVAATMQNFASAVAGDGSAAWGALFTSELDEINASGVVVIYPDASTAAVQHPLRIYGTFGTQADLQLVEYSDGTTPDKDYSSNTSSTATTGDPGNGRVGIQRQAAALTDGEIHYSRCNDVLYAWDDSDNVWQQMSGAGSVPTATSAPGGGILGKVTADENYGLEIGSGILIIDLEASTPGLQFVGGDLAAKPDTGAGIEVTASGIAVDLAASLPGLQFDGSGDLQAKPDTNAGIEVTANGIAIDLDPTDPGLEFNAGDLRVKVDGAHGIIRGTSGLEIEIDDTPDTLDVDADGLKVVGLPSLFKINDVAVGATVTAANLDTLTDGSNADALHTHAGSENNQGDWNVDSAVAAGDPVYWTSTGDRIAKADAATLATTKPFAVSVDAQSTVGQPATCVSMGIAAGVLSSATPGDRYYLAAGGGLTATRPTGSGNRVIQMGFAKNSTDLWVEIQDYGRVA